MGFGGSNTSDFPRPCMPLCKILGADNESIHPQSDAVIAVLGALESTVIKIVLTE